MRRFLIHVFVLSLSLLFLWACAGRSDIQRSDEEALPSLPRNLEQTQRKSSPSNPRAYYFFLLSQLKLRDGKVDEAI
ncbi:MAG TPA: hypothetical protein VLZ10_02140, partial [Thermodesulfobacteriota bacterium]|nr:hypothetical protein [Thermodesulfobacteriota bacterium]